MPPRRIVAACVALAASAAATVYAGEPGASLSAPPLAPLRYARGVENAVEGADARPVFSTAAAHASRPAWATAGGLVALGAAAAAIAGAAYALNVDGECTGGRGCPAFRESTAEAAGLIAGGLALSVVAGALLRWGTPP